MPLKKFCYCCKRDTQSLLLRFSTLTTFIGFYAPHFECSPAASACSVLPLPVLFLGRLYSHINVRPESRLPHLPLEPLVVIMTQIYWKTTLKRHQGRKSSNLWSRVCSSLFDVFHKISFISLLARLRFWRLLRACREPLCCCVHADHNYDIQWWNKKNHIAPLRRHIVGAWAYSSSLQHLKRQLSNSVGLWTCFASYCCCSPPSIIFFFLLRNMLMLLQDVLYVIISHTSTQPSFSISVLLPSGLWRCCWDLPRWMFTYNRLINTEQYRPRAGMETMRTACWVLSLSWDNPHRARQR